MLAFQSPPDRASPTTAMPHDHLAKTFDTWAQSGRGDRMEIGHGDVVAQVVPQLGIKAGDQSLDLGCGTGWATRMLAKAAPGAGAVGVDIAPEMVKRAEELHSYTIRARYEVAAFEELGLADAVFSHVFSMEAIYYAPDLDKALAEAFRVLKPGGRIDLVVDFYAENEPTAGWAGTVGTPMLYLSEADWREHLTKAGFEGAETRRVIDSRGTGDEADFEPSPSFPDWATWSAYREAGSLWIHGKKPA